jgi:hypothetical protein
MTPSLNLKRVALFSGLSAAFFLWIAPMLIMIGIAGLTTGGLGFALPFITTVFSLSMAEAIVTAGRISMPLHILFALLFNGGMLFTSSLHGLAHGIALKNSRVMVQLALASGVGGMLGFGLVNLVMDSIGLRVGAPNAAQTATVLMTMILGNIVGSFSGGAALGYVFAKVVNQSRT